MRIILTALCLMVSLGSKAQSQANPELQGQLRFGLDFSNLSQNITAGYAGAIPLGISSLNYSFGAEKHTQAEYDVLSFQIAHRTSFKLSQDHSINLTFPFSYDTHPTADLTHYAITPQLALVSSFRGGSTLTSIVEFSVDSGNDTEQHHSSYRIGGSYSFPFKKTQFEMSSSVAKINFKNAESHETFLVSLSASRRISEDINIAASASMGEDFTKVFKDGEIYRAITQQKTLSFSLTRKFKNFELSPYFSLNDLRSDFFETEDITAGFRTTWTY